MRNSLLVLLVASLSGCAKLYLAAERGDAASVRRLLSEGANIEGSPYWDNLGATPRPIRGAAENGHVEVVRILLERGAKIEDGSFSSSALYYSLLKQDVAVSRLLLEGGANTRIVRAGLENQAQGRSAYAAKHTAALALLDELETKVSPARPLTQPAASAPPVLRPNYHAPEDRPDDVAVIIGIESYSEFTTKAPFAERDADAVKAYVRALGVPERNIVLLKGTRAGKATLAKNIEQWLPRMVKPDSRVYFYFSGHGAPDLKTGQAYLVPWDGDPNFLETTAYPVAKLYQKLGELTSKQVLVAMDSCFSGAGGRSVLASGARPLVSKVATGTAPESVTVLAASAANEVSGSLDAKGYGAFTYYLLQGLNAGKTTPRALIDYLTPRVQDEARRLNRDQTPQLQGDGSWSLR